MVTKIYANAVAEYNDGKLLGAEKIRRLLDADFSDAVKILCDYGYGGGAVDENSYDIDAFISSETSALIEYVCANSPNEYLLRVLVNPFSYSNAKAYYKARVTGKEVPAAVYVMNDDDVKAAISRGEYAALPKAMADAANELDRIFSESAPNPKTIDIEFTKAMYRDGAECAAKSRSKTLREYVISQIDLNNIMSALRARALKMSEASLMPLFIPCGKLSEYDVISIFKAENVAKAICETDYDFLVNSYDETPDLPALETKIDDYLIGIWEKESENMTSFSPFVSYFTAQLNEYKTVKMILTCLKNNARGEIAARMRKAAR